MGFRGGGYWRLMRNVEEHRADVTWRCCAASWVTPGPGAGVCC